jgi:tetratricopeptide (TPR) repeat protein
MHSVTRWLEQLKQGDRQAVGPLWERYFTRLVHLARTWFPHRPTTAAASAEDAALDAFVSFCRRAEEDGFARLFDRDDLWQILVVLAFRKRCNQIQYEQRQRRRPAGGRVLVQAYLEETPSLRDYPDLVFELVCGEVLLRAERGEKPLPVEYLELVPTHQAQLRRLFVARRLLAPETVQGASDPATLRGPQPAANAGAEHNGGELLPPAPQLPFPGGELNERLGVGGMGEVYRLRDPALERDLAIKVIKADLRGHDNAEERFVREARITGCLQHPSIVPIHNLGRLADGRLYYTMKLVRGRTLADLLREEPVGTERLPRLLTILEKICQAMAYAHSKGIIHRDLKPSNVMVGKFGEVQVMDWGLAKVLSSDESATKTAAMPEGAGTVIYTAPASTSDEMSRTGAAMGTPSYMPPEQAMGERDLVDERADVFALGAMLCELLTGFPPYRGDHREEVMRRTRRGDLAEALGRLERCGADAALVQLCRECLAPEREGRPRNADVVAKRLAAYQAEVQERLQRAEVERAASQIKAQEERKRRRLTLALATLVLLLLTSIGAAYLWQQHQREQANLAVSNGLAQAELLAEQARADPLQTDKYRQALEAARVASQLAETASADARRQAQELIARLEQEETAARNDRELLAALLDVRGPREGPKYTSDAEGTMIAVAETTADEQFAAAFRRWGLDVDNTAPTEAVAFLKTRPAVVTTEVIAALDEWASERRRLGKAKAEWQRLADLASTLDDEPGSKRRELREIMARGRLPVERALGVLSVALRPVPIPVDVPLGRDRSRLRELAEQTNAATEPILGLLTLVRALGVAGDEELEEQLLRSAIVARPREVVLHHTLGQLLTAPVPSRWAEAVECYGAARVVRSDLGVNLAEALIKAGRKREGLELFSHLVKEQPNNPFLHRWRGYALHDRGQLDEAMAEYRQAIALEPKDAWTHHELGRVLHIKRQLDEAIAEYRQAIALDPKDAWVHNNLGLALRAKRQLDEAIAEYRVAIALDPRNDSAHINLGIILCDDKRDYNRAIACFRRAIALNPKHASAYYNLGVALSHNGQFDEAIAEYRQAIALDPKHAGTHSNLGVSLSKKGRLDEAIAEYHQAIALDPKLASAQYNLGKAFCEDKRDYDRAIACFRKVLILKPKYAVAHHGLGVALSHKGRLDEAIAEYRQAIALDPKHARTHSHLGAILCDVKHDYDGAVACFKKAIDLDPKYASAHHNLGNALSRKGQVDEAIACYKKAIALDPKNALAHNNLGNTLRGKGRLDEAIAEYRQAITLNPKDALPHYNLGFTLRDKGRLDEAIAEYRRAIALDPKHAWSHNNLGRVLYGLGRLDEARTEYRKAVELGYAPAAKDLQRCERLLTLGERLSAVIQGEQPPGDAVQLIDLADLTGRMNRYAISARLYTEAFASKPKLAANTNTWDRYNAACSAAQAAAGKGEDVRLLPDKVVVMFRCWALNWLRDELRDYALLADRNDAAQRREIQSRLVHWRRDPDLASIRDPRALEHLPENERIAWQALWRDVDELLSRLAKEDEAIQGRKGPQTPKTKP